MGLNPTLLMNLSEFEREKGRKGRITDCIECGSAAYLSSDRPLLDYIRMGKGKVMGIIRARKG